jgi:transposase InsO family protein
MLYSLRKFEGSEIAKERLRIIEFYEEYGEKATKEAFGADRKVISRWKRRLREGKGELESLMPDSTRPCRTRCSEIPVEIVEYIRQMRQEHPGMGKEKLKVFVDQYCKEKRLPQISESSIGNVIKRHKMFYRKSGRIYHDPGYWRASRKNTSHSRLRLKHPMKPEEFGHIVSDTVERITDRIKDYFYNAVDAKGKFALTLNYKKRTSRNMKDFYQRFQKVYPYVIESWQSDNGGENKGEFDEQLRKDGIPHYFSYPRCPKINTYIERYNRTVQEEFIDNNLDIIFDKKLFHQKLADYMVFYNAHRPHKSLGLKSPLQYIIDNGGLSHMSLTYTGG